MGLGGESPDYPDTRLNHRPSTSDPSIGGSNSSSSDEESPGRDYGRHPLVAKPHNQDVTATGSLMSSRVEFNGPWFCGKPTGLSVPAIENPADTLESLIKGVDTKPEAGIQKIFTEVKTCLVEAAGAPEAV